MHSTVVASGKRLSSSHRDGKENNKSWQCFRTLLPCSWQINGCQINQPARTGHSIEGKAALGRERLVLVGLLWAGEVGTGKDGGELLLKGRVTGNNTAGMGSNRLTLAEAQTLERGQQQEKNWLFLCFSEKHSLKQNASFEY